MPNRLAACRALAREGVGGLGRLAVLPVGARLGEAVARSGLRSLGRVPPKMPWSASSPPVALIVSSSSKEV
jgi:hypothetical protein